MKLKWNGIVFDDVSVDDCGHRWTQVCKACAQRHTFPDGLLDTAGEGICGIEGCENESDYYLDFPDTYRDLMQDREPQLAEMMTKQFCPNMVFDKIVAPGCRNLSPCKTWQRETCWESGVPDDMFDGEVET